MADQTDSQGPISLEQHRAQTMAKFMAGDTADETKSEEPKAQTDAVGKEDDESKLAKKLAGSDEESDDHEEGDDDEDEDEDEDEIKDEDEDDETGKDADLDKRIAQVRKAAKREKERLAEERRELQAEIKRAQDKIEAEWGPKIKVAEEFEELARRARYNTVEVLTKLGLGPDDFEDAAKDLYAASTAGQKDPKHREAASRRLQSKEQADKLSATEKKLAELEAKLEAKDRDAKMEAERTAYLDRAVRIADKSEKAALTKQLLAKNPSKTREALWKVADDLYRETGEVPEQVKVVARYERLKRAELTELGVDISAFIKAPAKVAKEDTDTKPLAKTDANSKTKNLKDHRAESDRAFMQLK